MKIPLDAPTEGRNENLSKFLGQKSLMKASSKYSLFVSYRQTMSLFLS
jgi:hypothetical protein